MFEGMSDDDDDFQSVSHSVVDGLRQISCSGGTDNANVFTCF